VRHRGWAPTPLIEPADRPPVPIAGTGDISRFRMPLIVVSISWLVTRLLVLRLVGRAEPRRVGRMIADFCQESGLMWIKLGQLISMRADLFPAVLCEELARLQDRALGFSPAVARGIVERELGRPIDEIFSHFEEAPKAAASIAQVHRARLRKGHRDVAVKVRRPGMDKAFKSDMRLIRFLLGGLERFAIWRFMGWSDLRWELNQVFEEELDYRYEVSNQIRMRKLLAKHQIYVPFVYRELCTPVLVVMEYIDAVSMADVLAVLERDPAHLTRWLKENGIDRERVGRRLLFSFLRQVFEDKLFHADLHPGNIFLMRESRIALIDFGSIGTLERDLLRKYDRYLEALSMGELAKAVDLFLLLAPKLPPRNLMPLKESLLRRLQQWTDRCRVPEVPYKEKSASWISDVMTRAMAENGITILWNFFKILRGWTTMDTCLREIIPNSDLPALMKIYTSARRKREARQILRHAPADLLRIQNLIDYPVEQAEMGIYQAASVRRLAQVFEGTTTRVSRLVASILGLGSAFCFIAMIAILWLAVPPLLSISPGTFLLERPPAWDLQIWLLLFAFFTYNSVNLGFLAHRFRRQE